MIILTDLATKLEQILNNHTGVSNPANFQFVVKSQGYHLDTINNAKNGKNTIPVFVSMDGGEYNPVPNLKEVNYTFGVEIYFPVRFKETFFLLNEYLADTFVGQKISIGSESALCNISVAQYGEIAGVQADQFAEWVEETFENTVQVYKKAEDINEDYMSMSFKIYATTIASGFLFGNSISVSLSYVKDSSHTYTLNNPTFDDAQIQSSTEPNGQQELNALVKEIGAAPQTTSYGSGFTLYYDGSQFCDELLKTWFDGNAQDITITITFTIKQGIVYTRSCYLKSVNLNLQKGQAITFTLAFAKRI